jgi:hypothetical protein
MKLAEISPFVVHSELFNAEIHGSVSVFILTRQGGELLQYRKSTMVLPFVCTENRLIRCERTRR